MATPVERGEELVALLTTPGLGRDEVDRAANELLSVLFAGLPVSTLVTLLRSTETEAVKAGAWLVSELGENARPIIGEVAALLSSPEAYVRHFALDAVITATTQADGELIGQAIGLVGDPNPGVRDKAVRLLAVTPPDRLTAALPHVPGDDLRALTEWLVRTAVPFGESTEVTARLGATDPAERLFALALAIRIADRDSEPLEHAAEAADPDVSSLAAFILRQRSRQRHRGR